MLENESRPRVQSLGFLAWQKDLNDSDLTVRAAVLVVDRSGHPTEFRYTDTVRVNQVQQTLYGAQFVTGFLGKVLFEPLISSVATDVSVWMVHDSELRSLRPSLGAPVLEVAPGSIGDWPKFCTHTLYPQDLDYVSDLYETAGQWSCMEVFNRMGAVLHDLPEESIVTVMAPKTLHRPVEEPVAVVVPEPIPEVVVVEAVSDTAAWPEPPVVAALLAEPQVLPEAVAEEVLDDSVEVKMDSFDEQPAASEKPDAATESSETRPSESVQAQLERLLVHLVENNQLQPTHYGYQVSGSLMWIHRAHFFNVTETVQTALPLTVEIDRELLRRVAQKGVIEAYEVYKELYGKMAVAFKLDLRKYPRLGELVAQSALTAVRSGS